MSTTCVRCGGEVDGTAYVDTRCADRARAQLAEIADMVPAARDIATGQARYSGSGGGSGKPGSRLPLDLAATAKLDGVLAALTIWVDRIGTTRGAARPWFTHHGDPIDTAARWLTDHLEWMRHQSDADQFLTDVEAAARVVRGLARGRAEQRYLGPCGALWWHSQACHAMPQPHVLKCECWCHQGIAEMRACEGDVYGRRGAHTGTCRTCGAQVDQDERRAWLDGEVRDHAFRAAEIANAYGVNANTIRTWHARGLLVEHGRDRDDRPLFNVGEVLDLAAADAARRETERAKRERRRETAA